MPTSPVTALYHRFDNYAINLYLLIMPREHILDLPVRSHSGVVTINLVICLIYRTHLPPLYFMKENGKSKDNLFKNLFEQISEALLANLSDNCFAARHNQRSDIPLGNDLSRG